MLIKDPRSNLPETGMSESVAEFGCPENPRSAWTSG